MRLRAQEWQSYLGGRKVGIGHGIALDVISDILLPGGGVLSKLVGDAILERVVGLGVLEQGGEGLEDGDNLGRGLPLVGFEDGEADVAERVVCHVGVVDAGEEAHGGGLEGVVGGQGEEDGEAARVVGRRGVWRGEDDVPGVEGLRGGERGGEALGGVCGYLGEFLGVLAG